MWFDKRLEDGTSVPGNWRCWVNINAIAIQYKPIGPMTITGNLVTNQMQFDIFATGPDRVRYNPPPPDVRAFRTGLPAAGFLDFPMIVNP